MIAWLNQLPCTRVDPLSHPDPDVQEICKVYERRGVHFELYLLPTDHPVKVFVAVAYQESGEGPATVVGLGADIEPRPAASRALLEAAQVRPALRQRLRCTKNAPSYGRANLRSHASPPWKITTCSTPARRRCAILVFFFARNL